MRCKVCSREFEDSNRFCPYCGTRVESGFQIKNPWKKSEKELEETQTVILELEEEVTSDVPQEPEVEETVAEEPVVEALEVEEPTRVFTPSDLEEAEEEAQDEPVEQVEPAPPAEEVSDEETKEFFKDLEELPVSQENEVSLPTSEEIPPYVFVPPVQEEVKRPKRKKWPIVLILLLIIALAAGGFAYYTLVLNAKTEINLADVTKDPMLTGEEEAGVATLPSIDEDKKDSLLKDIRGEKKRDDVSAFLATVYYSVDDNSSLVGLSNGDEIIFHINYSEEYAKNHNIEVTGTVMTYKVKGLKMPEDALFKKKLFVGHETDFVFPDSYARVLGDDEIIGLSEDNIQVAINEIYARHGYIFGSDGANKFSNYFQQYEWYQQVYTKAQFKASWLNYSEKTNVEKLGAYRDNKAEIDEAIEEEEDDDED